MAPPMIDLNKKQPLENVEQLADEVGENKLPLDPADLTLGLDAEKPPLPADDVSTGVAPTAPPTVVQQSPRHHRRHHGKEKRRKCKIAVSAFLFGAFLAATITAVPFLLKRHHHRHHHFRSHVEHAGHQAEEDVRAEGAMRTIYVARNESNHFFRLLGVLDYNTMMAGFKDCNLQRCYIDRLRESYEEGCDRWRHYMKHGRLPTERPLRVVGGEIDRGVLAYMGGPYIAHLCQGVPVHWVLEVPKGQHVNNTDVVYL